MDEYIYELMNKRWGAGRVSNISGIELRDLFRAIPRNGIPKERRNGFLKSELKALVKNCQCAAVYLE